MLWISVDLKSILKEGFGQPADHPKLLENIPKFKTGRTQHFESGDTKVHVATLIRSKYLPTKFAALQS